MTALAVCKGLFSHNMVLVAWSRRNSVLRSTTPLALLPHRLGHLTLSPLQVDESTVQKIAALTPNIGVAYSGMGPDSRVLVRKARKQAQAYYRLYKEQIPVAQLCRELATVMQEFTREPSSALLSAALASWPAPSMCRCDPPCGCSYQAGFDQATPLAGATVSGSCGLPSSRRQ